MRDDQNNEGRVSKTDGDDSKQKRTRIKAILDPKGSLLRSWNMMFLVSCVIAVLMDPLFLYLPIISREKKCLYLDKRLKIIAYSLRSFTDLIYILNMILQLICPYIDEASRKLGRIKVVTNARDIAKRYILSRYFVIDVFAILPLTQVSFSIIFIKMRDSGLLDNMKILNTVVLCQYVPRVLRIYIAGMNLTTSPMARLVWVKALFNFFLYLLVAHVLGAFWYLFSIQRLMVCWHSACRRTGCTSTSFKCNHPSSGRALSDDYCHANTTFFDFGIYHEALQSRTVESTNFLPRLTHCFWWGLRNLSSFGQNLQPSTLFAETFFVFCISISGLVLLVYFVGNEQASRQVVIQRSERVIRNMKIKEQETDLWISRNQLPRSMKKEIMTTVQLMLEEDEHIDVQNLLFALPNGLGRRIKHCICLPMLKKVPQLQGKSEQLLLLICDYLKPVHYNQQSYIVREGEPLDAMLFITHGILWNFTTNNIANRSTKCIEKGSFFGEELLDWGLECSPLPNLSDLPISPKTAKTHTKVEAFVLMANDLRIIVSRRTQAASTIQAAFRRFARKKENSLSSLRRRSTLIEMTSAMLPRGNRS